MQELDMDKEDNYPAEGNWEQQADAEVEQGPTGPTLPDAPAEEVSSSPAAELPPLVIDQKPVNFTETRSCSSEAIPGMTSLMSFILENPKTFNQVLERHSALLNGMHQGDLTTTSSDRDWLISLVAGMNHTNLDPTPIGGTEREGSVWQQGITGHDNGNLIRPGRPSQKIDRNKRHSKEELLAYLSKKSGLGATYETFMPRSGIWLRLRAPTLTEVVALQTEMQQIKLRLGMQTKGMSFSNAGSVMMNAMTDLALSCVIASNKSFITPSDLEHELSIFDEAILHHALASTMYIDGFNYDVPCIADPDNCTARITAKLNMSSIVWFDNTVFSNDQRKFIAKKFAPATDEDFKAYREGFGIGGKKVFWFGDIGVRLAIPTIAQRKMAASQWSQTLIEMSQGTFNEPPHGVQRSAYIDKLSKATIAMQYAHWVDGIYEKDDDVEDFEDQLLSDDQEIISDYLANTLSDPQYAEQFFDTVHEYTNSCVLAVVALPSHNCKECKGPQGQAFNERFPHLVPLDMMAIFFTLAGQKAKHLE
ncbi:hypothetical protein RVBP21_3460 [Pseudomonas phage BRkr]|nr:hypothetical protein RVBP21_3460 [Pseudomonas phage BRkr]